MEVKNLFGYNQNYKDTLALFYFSIIPTDITQGIIALFVYTPAGMNRTTLRWCWVPTTIFTIISNLFTHNTFSYVRG